MKKTTLRMIFYFHNTVYNVIGRKGEVFGHQAKALKLGT